MKRLNYPWICSLFISLFILVGCNKEEVVPKPEPPSNLEATVVSTTQINLSWKDNSDNETGFTVERKIGTDSYSALATTGKDEQSINVNGLTSNTNYSFRVHAYNSEHNHGDYSNEVSAKTFEDIEVTDVDGNVYLAVTIGTQVWMGENLKTSNLKDGTAIPLVTDDQEWNRLTTPGYSWYDNDKSNYGETYGGLYNWYAVESGKLCPEGWHVPSDTEWVILINHLGGEEVAGGKLKEGGTEHWLNPNTKGSNESGFRALPGGYHNSTGSYNLIGEVGRFWTSTNNDHQTALYWFLGNQSAAAYTAENVKSSGFSVRCVMD
jgi:uncharacterized protein (TIGR02145 family)